MSPNSDDGRPTVDLAALGCTLPPEGVDRRRVASAELFRQARSAEPIATGVRLAYAGADETARALLDFVLFERRCCGRLRYTLRFEPGPGGAHDTIVLELEGNGPDAAAVRAWAAAS